MERLLRIDFEKYRTLSGQSQVTNTSVVRAMISAPNGLFIDDVVPRVSTQLCEHPDAVPGVNRHATRARLAAMLRVVADGLEHGVHDGVFSGCEAPREAGCGGCCDCSGACRG